MKKDIYIKFDRPDTPGTVSYIIDRQGLGEILAALAEEAAELSQAALKLRRALGSGSPTPVSKAQALSSLIEEMGDVECCSKVICAALPICRTKDVEWAANEKLYRWAERIKKEERESGQKD